MTMTPEEKLAMARECAAEAKEGSLTAHLAPECIEEIREGGHDDWEEVQSALLAIDRMQERVRAETERLRNPAEKMWGGLARQLMMAFDMNAKTPRAIFDHLERTGHDIPDWLRDEPEMQALDHTVSKGTRVVIIWKAMFEAAIRETPHAEG